MSVADPDLHALPHSTSTQNCMGVFMLIQKKIVQHRQDYVLV